MASIVDVSDPSIYQILYIENTLYYLDEYLKLNDEYLKITVIAVIFNVINISSVIFTFIVSSQSKSMHK